MRLLVVPSASNFLQFLDFLPPEIFVQKCSESYFTSRRGLSHRFWSAITRRRVLRRYSSKFDLIFCEYADKNAAFLSEVVSKPLIIRAHQFEFDYPETTLDGINWSNVECLVVVSNHYKRLAKEMTPARKIEVIQNGVDVNKFSFQPSSSDKVCTFSFHEGRKRIYDLMLALRDQVLHIGGIGPDFRVHQETIRRFGLKHRLYGYVPLPEWLRDKGIFITHSMDESCGVALLEAMSCGLLCLAHDYAVADEIIPHGYRYVYDEELVQKLRGFMNMAPPEQLLRKKSLRSIIEQKFNVTEQADKFAKLFLEVADERN